MGGPAGPIQTPVVFSGWSRPISTQPEDSAHSSPSAYLIGGGIASLAAAVFLIRDAQWQGSQIHLFEASGVLGGSLDGAGNPADGYVIRGGRMFEEHFGCTYDLLGEIPTLHDPGLSAADDIRQFTGEVVTSSKCRLVVDGVRTEAPAFELSWRDRIKLIRLTRKREPSLGALRIEDYFTPAFFDSNFWVMWSTMFAFQRWHSLAECRRYMRRFMHLLPGFNRLEGIHRTRLNQFDSIVLPCMNWLKNRGVHFHFDASVQHLEFTETRDRVSAIRYLHDDAEQHLSVHTDDRVFITLGSMTEASTLGSMRHAPAHRSAADPIGSWSLWRKIAEVSPHFGNPQAFAADPGKTLWNSFTVTLKSPDFFDHMEAFTGNRAGSGGLVTFKHSGWMLSVVLAHQPHFTNQGDDTWVFWGYGLHPWQPGDAVDKPMFDCSGAEILTELAHHLKLEAVAGARLFAGANCIPCHMPFITAQFMPRRAGDRPRVVPENAENFAFLGQFCEVPDDTVFTVEYSVRTAQEGVYRLCGVQRAATPLYRGFSRPGVLFRALTRLIGNG